MLIICPSCATSYDIEPASLEPNGRRVRCVRCRTVWRAELNHAPDAVMAAGPAAPEVAPAETPADAAAREGLVAPATAALAEESGVGESFPVSPDDSSPPDGPAKGVVDGGLPDSIAGVNEAVEVEAPPIAPAAVDTGPPTVDVAATHPPLDVTARSDVETLAARRQRRNAKRHRPLWSLTRLQTVTLVLLIVDCVLIGWRKDIVRALPQMASFYAAIGLGVNLRGLSFNEVATNSEVDGKIPILVVQGNIVNDTGTAIGVPRLKFIVRNAAKQDIYSWTTAPPHPSLSPHEAIGFRTRLASPPPEGRDVLVRFVNYRDRVADTH